MAFESLDKVESYNNNKIIVAGDLNLTIDPNNETYNYVSDRNNVNSRARVKRFISDNNMADPFKYSLYSNPHYTWMKPNGTKAARLDRYLVSEEVEKFVSKNDTQRHSDTLRDTHTHTHTTLSL